jgi:hypothetical protein
MTLPIPPSEPSRPQRRFIHEGSLLEWGLILALIFVIVIGAIFLYNEGPWLNPLSNLGSPATLTNG